MIPTILARLAAATYIETVPTRYVHGRTVPTICVKDRGWYPRDIPWDELRHEFGNHVYVVQEWADGFEDDYPNPITTAWEIAAESFWDRAVEHANEYGIGRIWSDGRQGGWLIPNRFPPPDEWVQEVWTGPDDADADWGDDDWLDVPDIDTAMQWAEFERDINLEMQDVAYQVGWHLIVNIHDPIHDLQGVI